MSRVAALPGLDAETYQRHMLHADDRVWVEKNCYVDVCIELLHALRLEPLAALGSCAAVDFEGDNFTFYKPCHEDLRELFGVNIQELNVWLPIVEHAQHHLADGEFISTEADSFFLPDTAGTDYRRNHVKSTIILADLDIEQRHLGYFHNASYYSLGGDDFERLFRIGAPPDPTFLPLFAELVRADRLVRRPRAELAQAALTLLRKHLSRRAVDNPVVRFQRRFERDLPAIQERGLNYYHAWAFATVRQFGAVCELLALHVRWLVDSGLDGALVPAAAEFDRACGGAKTFILKAARAVNAKKPFDASATFDEMAEGWAAGTETLARRLGLPPPGDRA
jgi:hypothetical protein